MSHSKFLAAYIIPWRVQLWFLSYFFILSYIKTCQTEAFAQFLFKFDPVYNTHTMIFIHGLFLIMIQSGFPRFHLFLLGNHINQWWLIVSWTIGNNLPSYVYYSTETEMSSFWRNFHHWLHRKLSKWQLSVQSVIKISSNWQHFRFSVYQNITKILHDAWRDVS